MSFKPHEDKDVAAVIDRLLHDPDLLSMMAHWRLPRLSHVLPALARLLVGRTLRARFGSVDSVRSFQNAVAPIVDRLVDTSTSGFEVIGLTELDPDQSYLFMSNHRDIAGDSMLLNIALHRIGRDTVRIAVGDNLDQRSFATDIMKLNKSFFVNRTGESPREVYRALTEVSHYIRESLAEGQSVWIAQSEGRAKDNIDKTDTAVLKMLQLTDRKRPLDESLAELRIVPMALAYEFDPCDVAKARELTAVERDGGYTKAPGEDLMSLVNGLTGFKGRITLEVGRPFVPGSADVVAVAREIDRAIASRLRLYPVNFWALSRVDPDTLASLPMSVPDFGADVPGLERRLATCPPEYQQKWLQHYANPVLNYARELGNQTGR